MRLFKVLVVALASLSIAPLRADTFHVAPGESIQAALDAAASRAGPDIVQLVAGEYVEALVIADPGTVTLAGLGGTVLQSPKDEEGDPAENVVEIVSGDVVIRDLTITAGRDAIEAEPESADDAIALTLLRVRLVGNDSRGLDAEGIGDLTIIGCEISENGNDGLNVDDLGSVVIRGSEVSRNESDGIQIDGARDVTIVDSDASGNGQDGIQVEDTAAVSLTRLTVYDNGGADPEDDPEDGIDLEGIDEVRIVGVDLRGSFDDGLEVDEVGSIAVVHSTFSMTARDGLDIDDTAFVSLYGVSSTDNGGAGLQCEADEVSILSISVIACEFLRNGEDGVELVESEEGTIDRVLLLQVVAAGNAESGFDLDVSGELTLRAVTSLGNGEPDAP